jgi:hypothetical protein
MELPDDDMEMSKYVGVWIMLIDTILFLGPCIFKRCRRVNQQNSQIII